MKRIFQTVAIFALFPIFSNAQITIQADQIKPLGLYAIQARDTMLDASVVPGGNGLQTWDFTALKDQDKDTLHFYLPSETPYDTLFPQANLAATIDSAGYIYFEKNADHLTTLGSYGTLSTNGITLTTALKYNPGRTIIRFPMELNGTYPETIKSIIQVPGSAVGQPFFDSIRAVSTLQRIVEIDAYGLITSPVGTFNSLRSKEVKTELDSVFLLVGTVWSGSQFSAPTSDTTYNWWTNENGFGLPVVSIQIDGDGDTRASWLYDFISNTAGTQLLMDINLFPNPASDQLTLDVPHDFQGKVELYNMNGSLFLTRLVTSGQETIDISSLNQGSYVLVLKDQLEKLSGFAKFEVIR